MESSNKNTILACIFLTFALIIFTSCEHKATPEELKKIVEFEESCVSQYVNSVEATFKKAATISETEIRGMFVKSSICGNGTLPSHYEEGSSKGFGDGAFTRLAVCASLWGMTTSVGKSGPIVEFKSAFNPITKGDSLEGIISSVVKTDGYELYRRVREYVMEKDSRNNKEINVCIYDSRRLKQIISVCQNDSAIPPLFCILDAQRQITTKGKFVISNYGEKDIIIQ